MSFNEARREASAKGVGTARGTADRCSTVGRQI